MASRKKMSVSKKRMFREMERIKDMSKVPKYTEEELDRILPEKKPIFYATVHRYCSRSKGHFSGSGKGVTEKEYKENFDCKGCGATGQSYEGLCDSCEGIPDEKR